MLSENNDSLIYSVIILIPPLYLRGNPSMALNDRTMVDISISNFKRNLSDVFPLSIIFS